MNITDHSGLVGKWPLFSISSSGPDISNPANHLRTWPNSLTIPQTNEHVYIKLNINRDFKNPNCEH